MKHKNLFALVALLLVQFLAFSISAFGSDRNSPIKVMSFNIRSGTAKDGDNSWPLRKELVTETIRLFDPDLLGMQEVLKFQADYLGEQFPDYESYGVGRNDGVDDGEFALVFFKRERFELMNSGHFWLSETPEEVGSKSWDTALPRIATWVLLKDKTTDHQQIIFGNTHFDHKGVEARHQSAKLIRRRIESVTPDIPIIVTGDFNTHEELEPYAALVRGVGSNEPSLVDTYRIIHPLTQEQEGTFGGFQGRRGGNRIDWILTTPDITTLNAAINYTNEDGRYPSDHYPVEAVLLLR